MACNVLRWRLKLLKCEVLTASNAKGGSELKEAVMVSLERSQSAKVKQVKC